MEGLEGFTLDVPHASLGVSQDRRPLPGNSQEGKETCFSSLRLAGTREGETHPTHLHVYVLRGLGLSSTDPPRPAHKATCHYGFYQPPPTTRSCRRLSQTSAFTTCCGLNCHPSDSEVKP